MGTIDIDRFVEELLFDNKIYWDEERYSYEEFERIIKECVKKEVEHEYEQNDGEIDDWDYFEYNVICECNNALGNE